MLKIIIELVIGAVVAVIIYNVLHYFFVTTPTKKYQKKVKATVDTEVKKTIEELQKKTSDHDAVIDHYLGSQFMSNVWGRGVMVFEHRSLVLPRYSEKDADEIRMILDEVLGYYSCADGFIDEDERRTLIVTDCWLNKSMLVFDVADVINPATHEYLEDIKRLDKTKK